MAARRPHLGGPTKFNRPDPQRDWDWQNPSSLNLYQYARNNPVSYNDPTGYFVPIVAGGVVVLSATETALAAAGSSIAIWLISPDPNRPGNTKGDTILEGVYEVGKAINRGLSDTAEKVANKISDWLFSEDAAKSDEKANDETKVSEADREAEKATETTASLDAESQTAALNDLIDQSSVHPDDTGKKSDQQILEGDLDRANEEFDKLKLENIKDRGNGTRTGEMPDGRTVTVREQSKPTLEIKTPGKRKPIKIRFEKEANNHGN